tara:strand:- start:196 stop:456 length:261 start_codon:yes stop_codon:yes gene_type:complete
MKKIFRHLNKILIFICICIIRFYQILISPLLRSHCRFFPTCSEFTIDAIKLHGLIKGSLMSLKRISSCHPYGKEGYDPVIKKNRGD